MVTAADCVPAGWGTGPWGKMPWAGSLGATPGGPLPLTAPFDIYCVGPCGPMSVFTSYDGVEEVDFGGTGITVDPVSLDLILRSGGPYFEPRTVQVYVDTAVPGVWTLEFTFKSTSLPNDFSSLATSHIFIGTNDRTGACASLFFSKAGIAYTGSVFYDSEYVLHVDTPLLILPDSASLVKEDTYYTVRICCDSTIAADATSGTTFVYFTPTSELITGGHVLKYVLPSVPSDTAIHEPLDGTFISVCGSRDDYVELSLDSICLATGLIMPNAPPIADAGIDQSSRSCNVFRLDGSASYDPEGADLTYTWRFVDGPSSSAFVYEGYDGITWSPPASYTNKFHSVTLQDYHLAATTEIEAGDVLTVGDGHFDVVGTGTDAHGFYVQIASFSLPVGYLHRQYKLLKRNFLALAAGPRPTAYPDVSGLYKFELVVFDGLYFSVPSYTLVNVLESPVPRGITPDMNFMWNYLADSWQLVADREVLSGFWSSFAQVIATEMLTLWQHDYGKSLNDIQRAFQRRWLHYDPYIKEPVDELTIHRTVWGGVESNTVQATGTVVGLTGTKLVVTCPLYPSFEVLFQRAGAYTIANTLIDVNAQLKKVDVRFACQVKYSNDGLSARFVITAPFYFALTTSSTATLFNYPSDNDLARGSGGAPVAIRTYKLGRGLEFIDLKAGDLCVIGDKTFVIERIANDPKDTWKNQRVILSEDIAVAEGKDWVVGGYTSSTYLDFFGSLVTRMDTATFECLDKTTNTPVYIDTPVLGCPGTARGKFLTEIVGLAPYLSDLTTYAVYLDGVHRRTHLPIDPLVQSVPRLQEFIKARSEEEILRENIDYYVETYRERPCLRFITNYLDDKDVWEDENPPKRMWAETTYLDNRPTIEGNFGILADFTLDDYSKLPSSLDYLSAVRGLWYSYFNGPTIKSLRVGTQILLGLPFAEAAGTIVELDEKFSPKYGRMLIRDNDGSDIVRSYSWPRLLHAAENPRTKATFAIGDTVELFDLLSTGAEVKDAVSDPTWFQGYADSGAMFQIQKFFRFMVRVNSAAFNLPALMFTRSFIMRVKPSYTLPIFIISYKVPDVTVDVTDSIKGKGRLTLNDGPCGWGVGMGMSFDDVRAAGGAMISVFDKDIYAGTGVYPVSAAPIPWGFDRKYLCPEDTVTGSMCVTFAVPTMPTMDSIFSFDTGLFTDHFATFTESGIFYVSDTGDFIGPPFTATGGATITSMQFRLDTVGPEVVSRDVVVEIWVNGVLARTTAITIPPGTGMIDTIPVTSLSVVNTDVVTVKYKAVTSFSTSIATVQVDLGATYNWSFDTNVPAGTYCTYRMM